MHSAVKNNRNGFRTPARSETAPMTGETSAFSNIEMPTATPQTRFASPWLRPSRSYRASTQSGAR